MIDYTPLWETMKQKGISQYKILQDGLDNRVLDALKKNKNITMYTLEKICRICDCTPNEVIRFIVDEDEN
ncbi:MAG: helix-turn-helix domain-containing protein [Lachnospiraceae bacterium]|nr:helix-turn-helix domain-containing protein [Lachnospiraceae bacterium]